MISRLVELGPISADDLRRNFRDAWTAERGLQLGAETILGIGNHILSAHFGVSAEDHEAVLALLVGQGVIEEALGGRLRGLGGFRNILVHDYLRLDPTLVAESLARAPSDFSAFAAAVRGWLESVA